MEEFLKKSFETHGNEYDYSKVEKTRNRRKDKVCIICPKHGEFYQSPHEHMNGQNCPICSYEKRGDKRRKEKNVFVKEAENIYNTYFSYEKVEYKNNKTKVCVTCPEHGDFWVTPNAHLRGVSCPMCSQSSFESKVRGILNKYSIKYSVEKTFKWLGRLRLDFYLPDYVIAIECQGEQHYMPVDFFSKGEDSAKETFEKTLFRDKTKLEKCTEHGIPIIYIKYNIKEIENYLLNELKKYIPIYKIV